MKQQSFANSAAVLGLFLMFSSVLALGQAGGQFQAQAMGEGTLTGRTFGVTIIIREYSTPTDQKVLMDAFAARGNEGLSNAASKMSAKGRIAITGTLGFDVNYIRIFETPTGRKIRMVADRPITFGEAWSDTRSQDYTLSGIEINVDANSKGTGTLIPACQLKMNIQNELEIEALRNPVWPAFCSDPVRTCTS